MKRVPLLALIAAASVALATPAFAADEPTTDGPTASYIVQFTPGSDRAAEVSKAKALGMRVTFEYATALSGMAVEANKGQLTALEKNPNVRLIEADGVATISDTQSSPTWGLDRIDEADLPMDSAYVYPSSKGTGVRAYIIDTGINVSHQEFTGRTAAGFDAVTSGGSAADCNGHGTHVAGTVGGTTYGVAKGVTLIPVRVLDCSGSGSWSGVIAGVDWVAADAKAKGQPAVANMSLGGGVVSSLNTAVTNAINGGVTFAVAAGNETTDACTRSPASTPAAITVGSTTSTDARSSFSNFGTCLDIFAPGSSITSAWFDSNTATNTISGTSMATPHVAGAAALYLGLNTTATPQQVRDALVNAGTKGKVTSAGTGSPNVLLFTGALAPVVPGSPTVASISPSSATVGTSVTLTGTNLTGATVTFNGTPASVTTNNGTSLTTAVPAGATSGAVVVTNSVGSASTSFTVLSAPAAPTMGSVTSPSAGKATVRWTLGSNGGSPLTAQTLRAYRVLSGVTQGTASNAWNVSTTTTAVTVSNLVRGATYRFEVTVSNVYGSTKSSLSSPVVIR